MRVDFTRETDVFQVLGRADVEAFSQIGWHLCTLRGERVLLHGRTRQCMDVTLRSSEGKCAVLMMLETDGDVLVLPNTFAALDPKVLSELATQLESKLDRLRNEEGRLPDRFLMDGEEMSTGRPVPRNGSFPAKSPMAPSPDTFSDTDLQHRSHPVSTVFWTSDAARGMG